MVTVWTFLAAACGGCAALTNPGAAATSAAATMRVATEVTAHTGKRARRGTSASQRSLYPFRMLEVIDEERPHLHECRLELGVLSAWNQYLVHRIDDGLVISDLVIDVGLVERGAVELLERREVFLASLTEAPARRVAFRCHVQLVHERDRGSIDTRVIGDHPLGEVPDRPGVCPVLSQLAGVDVDLIGGDDDGGDLGVGGRGALRPGDCDACAQEGGHQVHGSFHVDSPENRTMASPIGCHDEAARSGGYTIVPDGSGWAAGVGDAGSM